MFDIVFVVVVVVVVAVVAVSNSSGSLIQQYTTHTSRSFLVLYRLISALIFSHIDLCLSNLITLNVVHNTANKN